MVTNGTAIRTHLVDSVRRGSNCVPCQKANVGVLFCRLADCSPLFAISAGLSARKLTWSVSGYSSLELFWCIMWQIVKRFVKFALNWIVLKRATVIRMQWLSATETVLL